MSNPLHPSVLAIIGQIQAIADRAGGPASDLDRGELVAIQHALVLAIDDVESRIGWLDTITDTAAWLAVDAARLAACSTSNDGGAA